MANDKNFKVKNSVEAKAFKEKLGTVVSAVENTGPVGAFSTDLWTGDGTSGRDIVTGIDLANDGGAVWTKKRNATGAPHLFNTISGANKYVLTSSNDAEDTFTSLTSFNDNGFTVSSYTQLNNNSDTFVAWSFKKQSSFFDVVTYTGDGTQGRTISHALGSVPGCILVKTTSASGDWAVYHRGVDATAPEDYKLELNGTGARQADYLFWDDTAPTSTDFTVGAEGKVNGSGKTYVAYLFAHDTSASSSIQCGSYTGNGSAAGPEIDLGWEPQWLMIKSADAGAAGNDWFMFDSERGMGGSGTGSDLYLDANTTDAETGSTFTSRFITTSTGFQISTSSGAFNTSGDTYVYIAIRKAISTNKRTLDLSTGSVFEISSTSDIQIGLSNPAPSGTMSAATLKLTTPLVMDIGNLTYDGVSSSSYTSGQSWFLAPNGRSGMWQNVVSEDVRGFRFASPWDLSTTTGYGSNGDGWRGVFNESATIANFTGLFGSTDGKFMYALSDSSNKLMRWSLVENPFNLSVTNPDQSLSVSGSFSDNTPTDLSFSLDGKWVYVMGNQDEQIKSKQLSVPWSLESAGSTIHTTLSEPPDPRCITFTPDGKTLLVYDRSNTGEVHQYSLSTAWDPRTKTYVKKKALTTSPGTTGSTMFSSTDRNYPKLYLGSSGGNQYQYTMDWSTYNISFDDSISFPGGAPSSFPLGGVTILTFSTTDGGTSYTASHALEEAILSYEIDISGDLPE